MDAIWCFIGKSQNQWDLHIQQIAGALRSSVNCTTCYTANMLMLGRQVNTPAYLMFLQRKQGKFSSQESYLAELVANMEKAHKTAQRTMRTISRLKKRNFDLRLLERNYQVRDAVYLLDTAVLKGKCKKLCPPWKGPEVIVLKLSSFSFRVKLRNAVFVVNHDCLKPCRDREVPHWIKHWRNNPGISQDDATSKGGDQVYRFCRKQWQG